MEHCRTLQEILKIPANQFSEGDVVISNDSWLGTGHLNDITMVSPISKNKKLIAFAGSTAHTVDMEEHHHQMLKIAMKKGYVFLSAK